MQRIREMELESRKLSFEAYVAKFAEGAGIVEERITGTELESPSVQLRVQPGGKVELLSTHDQLLGGASGQSYLGCVFPAAPEYARLITRDAELIGQHLAREGALGRFAVDFVVVRGADGEWSSYAIELNLRKGGTTHPFLDPAVPHRRPLRPRTALFLTPRGHEKHLVATDHLEAEELRGTDAERPVRHRGPARAALRPVPSGRHRLPHDQLPHRARPDRAHGGRRQRQGGGPEVPGRPADPAGGGQGSVQEQPLP